MDSCGFIISALLLATVACSTTAHQSEEIISGNLDKYLARITKNPQNEGQILEDSVDWLQKNKFNLFDFFNKANIEPKVLAAQLLEFDLRRDSCNRETLTSVENVVDKLKYLSRDGLLFKSLVKAISNHYKLCSNDYLKQFFKDLPMEDELGQYLNELLDHECKDQEIWEPSLRMACLESIQFDTKRIAHYMRSTLEKNGALKFNPKLLSETLEKTLKQVLQTTLIYECVGLMGQLKVPLATFAEKYNIQINMEDQSLVKSAKALYNHCNKLFNNRETLIEQMIWS